MIRVIIRVDASLQIGIGHVMRCLTLAQGLQEKGIKVKFICRKHKGNLIDKIRSKGFHTYELESSDEKNIDSKLAHASWLGVTQQKDVEDCINILKIKKTDWLIVDHYGLDEQWQKSLKPYYKKLMVIDDLADRQFDCDVLLNQNFGSHKDHYINKLPKSCKLLIGCEYALLRPEFLKLRSQALEKRRNTKKIKNILISMGGSDIKNITYDILRDIDNNYNVVVALGKDSPHNIIIKDHSKNKGIKIIIDADNMAELMFNADLAIGAAGSTSWERCCSGLPTLVYITADNQNEIAENLQEVGAVKIVKNLKKDLLAIVSDFSLWKSMSKISNKVCDGHGVNKVIKYLQ